MLFIFILWCFVCVIYVVVLPFIFLVLYISLCFLCFSYMLGIGFGLLGLFRLSLFGMF
jgi:hypothetical protein